MKLYAILLTILFLGACDIAVMPIMLRNAYFDEILLMQETEIPYGSGNKTISNAINIKNQSDAGKCGILCGADYTLTSYPSLMESNPEKVFLYQGSNDECLLYSYTRKELQELKQQAGFSLYSNAVFLIEKDGLHVVSQKEYNNIAPTFVPHKFDSALCK